MLLHALPALADNLVWTLQRAAGAPAVVVDPGDAAPVLAAADAGLPVEAVLLTHHHLDHVGGVEALRARWPALRVFAPHEARIAHVTRRVGDGIRFEAAGIAFDTLTVPAHTRSHVAFVADLAPPVLFCGDTLFSLGCGRLFEGTPAQLHAALARLAALPGDTRLCCGHEYTLANARFAQAVEPGNPALAAHIARARQDLADRGCSLPTTLAAERAANPFLRASQPQVRAAVQARAGIEMATEIDVLGALRAWKDVFA